MGISPCWRCRTLTFHPSDAATLDAGRLRRSRCHASMTSMALMIDMRVCELLTARLCHDLAGPIAAIGNGAELLDDEDPDFVRQAATLIGDSAGTAAKRLQL